MQHVLLSCKPVKILFFLWLTVVKLFITQHGMCYFDTLTLYQNLSLHIQLCDKEYFPMNLTGNFYAFFLKKVLVSDAEWLLHC